MGDSSQNSNQLPDQPQDQQSQKMPSIYQTIPTNWNELTLDDQNAIKSAVDNSRTILLPDNNNFRNIINKEGTLTNVDENRFRITFNSKEWGRFFGKNRKIFNVLISDLFYDDSNKNQDAATKYRLKPTGQVGQATGVVVGGYRKTKSLHKKSNKPKKNRTWRRKY